MTPRVLTFLRFAVALTVVGIVVAGVLLVQALVSQGGGAPRTAAERAILSAEEAVRVNPDDPVARVRLAAAYLEQGSYGLATEQARFALQLNPDMPDAHFVLGVAQYRMGELDEAIRSLTTAAETEGQFAPFYQEVYVALARAYEDAGRIDEALQAFEDGLAYAPENAAVVLERAQMLERAERWLEAAYDYGYALIFIPDYPEALEGLNRIESAHPEEYQEAMDLIDQVRPEGAPHSEGDVPADDGTAE